MEKDPGFRPQSDALQAVIELAEGGEIDSHHRFNNSRELVHDFIVGEKSDEEIVKQRLALALEDSSPIRSSILRKAGGITGIEAMIEGYTNYFLPNEQSELERAFDKLDSPVFKGGPNKDQTEENYRKVREKIESAETFVEFLSALKERMLSEKKAVEQQIESKERKKAFYEQNEKERLERGKRNAQIFENGLIESKTQTKMNSLRKYAMKIGAYVLADRNGKLTLQQREHLSFGSQNLREKMCKIFPNKDDRNTLVEHYINRQLELEKELLSLQHQAMTKGSLEELKPKIEQIKKELDEATLISLGLQR